MNKNLYLAVAVGLVAGAAHLAYLSRLEAEVVGGQQVKVLVAAQEMSRAQKVTRAAVATRQVPEAYVDGRVIRPAQLHEILDLPLAVTVEAGGMLQWSDFLSRDEGVAVDLASLVEPGERAMTIPVDRSLSMGGNLRPGHRVDILGTFDEALFSAGKHKSMGLSLEGDQKIAVTLLQNVTVLATGQETGAIGGSHEQGRIRSFRTVTLSVSLEEGELLAYASTQASLSLVLRGAGDLEIIRDVPEKSIDDIRDAGKRNDLQSKKSGAPSAIERLRAR